MRKKNFLIISLLIIIIFIMSVGYATFTTTLEINGEAEITGTWDVKITKVEVTKISDLCDAGTPSFTNTNVTFNAKLNKPGDTITYLVTIKNEGTIDAKLNNILFTSDEETGSNAISYKTSEVAPFLNAKEETTLEITVTYKENITENETNGTKTITGIIEYIQK